MNYREINDYELYYLIKEKDEYACDIMYKKYKPLIDKYARQYYKKYKDFSIEYDDLFQEGMIGLSGAIETYDESKNALFYSYALLFIKRRIEHYIKSATRCKHQVLNEALSMSLEYGDTNTSLGDFLCREEQSSIDLVIDAGVSKRILDFKYLLKDKHACVYELRLNNFSNREIAHLLDIDYKAVDNSLRAIKEKFDKYNY